MLIGGSGDDTYTLHAGSGDDTNNPDTPLATWDVATLNAMAAQATLWDDYLIAPEGGGVLADNDQFIRKSCGLYAYTAMRLVA